MSNHFEDAIGDAGERFYRRQDKARVGTKVDSGSIRRLFSPSYGFAKWHALYRESGPEEHYCNAIVDALLESGSFSAVRDLKPARQLAGTRETEIFHGALRHYMESRDELPVSPRPEEWAAYLRAPLEVMQEVCPAEGVDIGRFLPLQVDSEDFTLLFHPRISAIYEREISQSEQARDALSLLALENLFTELATGESNDPDDEAWFMRKKLSTELGAELAAIRVYREELSSGTIKTKMSEVLVQNIATGEAVGVIVEAYFGHLLDSRSLRGAHTVNPSRRVEYEYDTRRYAVDWCVGTTSRTSFRIGDEDDGRAEASRSSMEDWSEMDADGGVKMNRRTHNLLRTLVTSTEAGEARWTRDDSESLYSLRLMAGTVVVDRAGDREPGQSRDDHPVRVRVYHADGTLVEHVTFDVESRSRALALRLVQDAHRSAIGTMDVIDEMVAELEGAPELSNLRGAIEQRQATE